MKLTEKILGIIILIGIILMLIPIPGGSILAILGVGLLSLLYFYLGFAFFNGIRARNMFKKASYVGIKGIRIAGAILTGMSLSTVVVGILFKVMLWNGASSMLLISFVPLLVLIVISTIKYLPNKEIYYKNILVRSAVFGGIALFLLILPVNTILKLRHRNNPEYVNAVIAASEHPDDEALQQKADKEWQKMHEGE